MMDSQPQQLLKNIVDAEKQLKILRDNPKENAIEISKLLNTLV